MSRFTTRARELLSAAKAGNPIPKIIDRSVDAETLWPASLENEAEKAASILRSFFCDGFIVPYRTLAVCDQSIVGKCHGLAVFYLLRDGFGSPAASGSGVLISHLDDGKWSGPAAILVENKASLPSGVDVLDVVLVVNDKNAMEALLDPVVALKKCLSVAPGPIPHSEALGVQSPTTTAGNASVWSYAKSKGELVEIDLSELVIRDAGDENELYYGVAGVSRREILQGQAVPPSGVSDHLSSSVRSFERQTGSLSGLASAGKCPGDCPVSAPADRT